jgi:hypothetical protein
MLVELIFKGDFNKADLNILEMLLGEATEVRFNFPFNKSAGPVGEINSIVGAETYIDLAISTDKLKLGEMIIPNVFINFGRNYDDVEVLLFFNIDDIKQSSTKGNFNFLRKWAEKMIDQYRLTYYICQLDNGTKDEYFFDSHGYGPLYL